ncbi:MAG: SGNH/GDSL hydrolase family protein [Casimicrobiaceae bacterium]
MQRTLARKTFGRLILVGFGLILSLFALEIALQLGALFISVTGYNLPVGRTVGQERVVCLGDSNTYGLYVGRPEAYPQVLERLLAEGTPDHHVEVMNLGVPGMNSSKLRSRFRDILKTLRPDTVLMMVGANDNWTVPVPETNDSDQEEGWSLYTFWQYSRVFRLLYMIRRAFEAHHFDMTDPTQHKAEQTMVREDGAAVELTWTGESPFRDSWMPELQRNLELMSDEARQAEVKLVLLTYPSEQPDYRFANAVVRTTAARIHRPLVDLGAEFLRRCPDRSCPDLFLPDHHPTAKGYEIVASVIAHDLTPTPAAQ